MLTQQPLERLIGIQDREPGTAARRTKRPVRRLAAVIEPSDVSSKYAPIARTTRRDRPAAARLQDCGQSSRLPASASTPPSTVLTMRSPARCQSPAPASASSTKVGVRKTEKAA